MTIDQILKLSQAGFSAEQITALAPLIKEAAPATETKPENKQETQQETKPETQSKQETRASDPYTDLLGKFDELQNAIKTMNIQQTRQQETKTETAEDVLASIVLPGYNK